MPTVCSRHAANAHCLLLACKHAAVGEWHCMCVWFCKLYILECIYYLPLHQSIISKPYSDMRTLNNATCLYIYTLRVFDSVIVPGCPAWVGPLSSLQNLSIVWAKRWYCVTKQLCTSYMYKSRPGKGGADTANYKESTCTCTCACTCTCSWVVIHMYNYAQN